MTINDDPEVGPVTPPAPSAPNVYQRINNVRRKVGYVQKTAEINQKYMAVTHDAVTAALRDAMIEEGLIVTQDLESSKVVLTGTETKGGVPFIRYEAVYRISMVPADLGYGGVVNVRVEAHAVDEGDKAPGKAMSYALKYFLLKIFNLETGENEEARETGEPEKINKVQVDELIKICDDYGWQADQVLMALATHVYKLEDIGQLRAKYFDDAKTRLKRKYEQQPKAGADHSLKSG